MTPEDKKAAREAIERGRLTVDQVQVLVAEAEKTGRPFETVAREKGLLRLEPPAPPPAPPGRSPLLSGRSPLYPALMGASLFIFAGLLVATLIYRFDRSRKDRELDIQTEESRVQTERAAQAANMAYHRRRLAQVEADANASLERARETLAWIDERIGTDPTDPTLPDRAMEAKLGVDLFLKSFPDDAPALVLRSRAWEHRRNYDRALEDLERALVLRPALEPEVRRRLDLLRTLNTKPAFRKPG